MITGFNTDIKHNEKVYHIQTEDKGSAESVHRVAGLRRRRDPRRRRRRRTRSRSKGGVDEKWIGSLMEQQHRTMIAAIKRGRFDQPADATKSDRRAPTMPTRRPAPCSTTGDRRGRRSAKRRRSTRSSSTTSPPRPRASISSFAANQIDFFAGTPVEMRVAAKKSLSQNPDPRRGDRGESHLHRRAAARDLPRQDRRRRHRHRPLHHPRRSAKAPPR